MPRDVCKYGAACYRKNPTHFQEYSHPWLDKGTSNENNQANKDDGDVDNNIGGEAQTSQLKSDESETKNDNIELQSEEEKNMTTPEEEEDKEKIHQLDSSSNQFDIAHSKNNQIKDNEDVTTSIKDDASKGTHHIEVKKETQEAIQKETISDGRVPREVDQNSEKSLQIEETKRISPKKVVKQPKDDIVLEIIDSLEDDRQSMDDDEPQSSKRKRHHSNSSVLSSSRSPKSHKGPQNPLNFYLTKVKGIDKSYNNLYTLSIVEILSSKWGQLEESVQFNYMFEIDWLIQQYPPCFRHLPILLVHQDKRDTTVQLEADSAPYGNISLAKALLMDAFGTHHTKMMILKYKNFLRVVIHTANLIEQDWREKTQGIWMSPMFPELGEDEKLEDRSPTKFQTDLIQYLRTYKSKTVDKWCETLKRYNMSSANVFIIGSTPGRHSGAELHKFGHMKLRKILSSEHAACDAVQNNWPVIGQFSSIGTLGKPEAWLQGEFLQSLSSTPKRFSSFYKPPMKLIFPCVDDVRNSLEGYPAGGSLPYSDATHQKQLYLTKFLHRWISDDKGRTRASPHIKSYFRVSPEMSDLHYAVLTSANLSKAAWGSLEKQGSQLCIRSFELGVLFLPKFFSSFDTFSVSTGLNIDGDGKRDPISFPVPFDLPPTRYGDEDEPWRWDISYKSQPDSHGNIWDPS